MPGTRLEELEELQRRQEELLAGLQTQAEYPELLPSVGDFERDARVPGANDRDGIMTTSDALPDFSGVTTNRYRYKPEFQDSPGAGRGEYTGPMSRDLRGIPGVVQRGQDGMDRVDPGRLSMANASATGENSRDIAELRRRLDALSGATRSDSEDEVLRAARSGRY